MLQTMKNFCLMALLAATLPACATITTGTSQSISVLTQPTGASCTLTRDGSVVGVVNPTPGTITISKSTRDLTVNCTRQGHTTGVTTVPSQFQGMTAGNILIGGIIGIGVDAASGAMSQYPSNVHVVLVPETFGNDQSRDDFFLQRGVETRRLYDERIQAVRSACAPGERAACDGRTQALQTERDEELNRLDLLRRNARVGS